MKAADASVRLWLCRAGNSLFLLPKRPGNQQRKRSRRSQTRISTRRWAGRQLGCPVHLGAVSPAVFDQSCVNLLALRLQTEGGAGKGLLWPPCQRAPGLAQTTMAVRPLAASCMFRQGRISPCSRTLSKGRKYLQVGWLPRLPKQLLGLYDSSKEYVITILACLIWLLHDLPCGLLSPGRKNSYCAARWFRFFQGD